MEQRNLLLAVAASIAILLGWQFLFEAPRIEKQRAAQEAAKLAQPPQLAPSAPSAVVPTPTADGSLVPGVPAAGGIQPTPPGGVQVPVAPVIGGAQNVKPPREAIIADQPRVRINAKRLIGTIRLNGQCRQLPLSFYHGLCVPHLHGAGHLRFSLRQLGRNAC